MLSFVASTSPFSPGVMETNTLVLQPQQLSSAVRGQDHDHSVDLVLFIVHLKLLLIIQPMKHFSFPTRAFDYMQLSGPHLICFIFQTHLKYIHWYHEH